MSNRIISESVDTISISISRELAQIIENNTDKQSR